VAAAGKEGEEEDLANKDAFPTLNTTAPAEVVAAGAKDGERWNELPSSGDVFQDFLDDVVRVAVVLGIRGFLTSCGSWLRNDMRGRFFSCRRRRSWRRAARMATTRSFRG
jgi:hypothetical protein